MRAAAISLVTYLDKATCLAELFVQVVRSMPSMIVDPIWHADSAAYIVGDSDCHKCGEVSHDI